MRRDMRVSRTHLIPWRGGSRGVVAVCVPVCVVEVCVGVCVVDVCLVVCVVVGCVVVCVVVGCESVGAKTELGSGNVRS